MRRISCQNRFARLDVARVPFQIDPENVPAGQSKVRTLGFKSEILVVRICTWRAVDSIVPRRMQRDLYELPREFLTDSRFFNKNVFLNRLECSFLTFKPATDAMGGRQLGCRLFF